MICVLAACPVVCPDGVVPVTAGVSWLAWPGVVCSWPGVVPVCPGAVDCPVVGSSGTGVVGGVVVVWTLFGSAGVAGVALGADLVGGAACAATADDITSARAPAMLFNSNRMLGSI